MKTTKGNGTAARFLPACLLAMLLMCLLAAAGFAADGDFTPPENGLPVVYLNVDESRGTIEDMLTADNHSLYCYGEISIDVPTGFHYADFPDTPCESVQGLAMSIRGRGNSTWQKADKKPFKIKLEKKADLFGLGKNKHWVLIANAFDETLLRDRVTAWLGDEMGFAFTPRGVPVDVVLVGETYGKRYLGSYYLSENVRVDDNRLEIDELTEDDTDPLTITGGYLLQNALQVRKGSPDRFYTDRGVDWATHTPSFDTEENASLLTAGNGPVFEGENPFTGAELGDGYVSSVQQTYIQNYIRHFEDVLFEEGTAYRELMDVESAAKYWLVNMISLNNDAFGTGSTYLYKVRDTEDAVGKLYWGPLWDFDYAWDRNLSVEGFDCGHDWMRPMFYDTGEGGFVEELHRQWPVMRQALLALTEAGGLMDAYCAETKASAEQDYLLYHPNGRAFDYEAEVDELRTWIRARVSWVDENLGLLDRLVHKVTLLSGDEVYRELFVSESGRFECDAYYPEREGFTFMGWAYADGSPVEGAIFVREDMTLTAVYVPDDAMTHATDIAFIKDSDIIHFNAFFSVYTIRHVVLPEDAEDQKVFWSSSDPSVAEVYGDGSVRYHSPGTVVITARVPHGTTRAFTLTVTTDEPPAAEAIAPETETIRLRVGQQSPCMIRTAPTPAALSGVEYLSEDESVVTVGELGVLTAVAPGQTVVRVRAEAHDADWNPVTLETAVTVIVTDGTDGDPASETAGPCPWCGEKHDGATVAGWWTELAHHLLFILKRIFLWWIA